MHTAAWRRFCFAVLPGMLFTSTLAADDARVSARRTAFQAESNIQAEPNDPLLIVEPDDQCPIEPICTEEIIPLETPYCDAPYSEGCDVASECCDPYDLCPCWTIRGGAIFLKRDGNTAIPLVAGTPSYSTADLGFDYEAGPQISVIRHGIFGSWWDFEVAYFGVNNLDATATTADIDSLATTPIINVPGVLPARTDYTSRLDSVELNLRRQTHDWLTLLGGFRWVEVGEELNTTIGGLATHGVDVNNHLYGIQVGADAILFHRGAFSFESFSKIGIYGNSADSVTTTTGIGAAIPVVIANEDHVAFVGEMAFTGVYDFNDRWSVRGGYELLWLDGVALATEQLDNVNIGTGVATVDVGQTAFYHGFTLAAQFVW